MSIAAEIMPYERAVEIFKLKTGVTEITEEHDSAGPRLYAMAGKLFYGEISRKKIYDTVFSFKLGQRVRKFKGSSWQGKVVGFYSTELTPVGYAVESEREPGSVQIYPEAALCRMP